MCACVMTWKPLMCVHDNGSLEVKCERLFTRRSDLESAAGNSAAKP